MRADETGHGFALAGCRRGLPREKERAVRAHFLTVGVVLIFELLLRAFCLGRLRERRSESRHCREYDESFECVFARERFHVNHPPLSAANAAIGILTPRERERPAIARSVT